MATEEHAECVAYTEWIDGMIDEFAVEDEFTLIEAQMKEDGTYYD